MAKILKFQQEPEENTCDHCCTVEEFLSYVLDADSEDELREILSDLFAEGKLVGYQQALHEDIQAKISILIDINGVCECDDCQNEDDCELDK